MSNFTKRLIAFVLLVSHLLVSCGCWEAGECDRGAPGKPGGCGAPGKPGHGKYVEEESPSGSLMTLDGFIAAFNRVYTKDLLPVPILLPDRAYPDLGSSSSSSSLSALSSLRPASSSMPLHLPPGRHLSRPYHGSSSSSSSSSSFTDHVLSSSQTLDGINSLVDLGKTLIGSSEQMRQVREYHQKETEQIIAAMKLSGEQFKRKLDECARQAAIEAAKKEEQDKLAAKAQKEKERQAREERLKWFVDRRKEVEAGRTKIIKPSNYFIASLSSNNVKRIQNDINELREQLDTKEEAHGFTSEQEGDIKDIVQRIDRLSVKLQGNIEDIKYFIAHPSPDVRYTAETLELATKLLQELSNQKEELRKLVSTREVDLDDYVDKSTPAVETEEERTDYKELTLAINDPRDAMQWVGFITQQMKELLEASVSVPHQTESMGTQATHLATRAKEVLKMLESKDTILTELYFGSDTSDYMDLTIEEGMAKLKHIHESIVNLKESLSYFCRRFLLTATAEDAPIITKERLKVVFNALVDLLVPGSELVKAVLGTRPLPSTPEAWADLALSAGLDFMPLGKGMKLFIGPVSSAIHSKVKEFIVKLLKKRGKKVSKILQGSRLFGKVVEKTTVRMGKHGKSVEIFFQDGSKMDINAVRVKQWIPIPHPKAPPGTLQRVEFKEFLPGSKGYKRLPTPEELGILNKF